MVHTPNPSPDVTDARPRIVLFQPDIPGNTGTILRMAVCLNFAVDIIEPAGFRLDDKTLMRSGMDYIERSNLTRHMDWEHFEEWRKDQKRRLVLLTTKTDHAYTDFAFEDRDCLLFGRESAGAPPHVHAAADQELTIPMAVGERSLNLAVSAAMVGGEICRQLGWRM